MPLTTEAARGFLASLLDISFRNFIATRVIPVLYVLAMIGIALTYFGVGFSLLRQSSGAGFFWFILAGPLFALFDLIWIRVLLEIAIVFFRIREDTSDIRGSVSSRA